MKLHLCLIFLFSSVLAFANPTQLTSKLLTRLPKLTSDTGSLHTIPILDLLKQAVSEKTLTSPEAITLLNHFRDNNIRSLRISAEGKAILSELPGNPYWNKSEE
jgi:hypothetical protein